MKIPNPIAPEGIYISLNVAYTGFKAIPAMTFGKNDAFPKFRLFEDATETRVIFSRRKRLSEIETVDVGNALFNSRQITIVWKNSLFTFIAVPQYESDVFDCVRFFKRKGVPLSGSAENLYNDTKNE